MNILPFNKKVEIVSMLVTGESLRSISRQTDVSANTIKKLFFSVGQGCVPFHNDLMNNLNSTSIQITERWLYKNRIQSQYETLIEYDILCWIGIELSQRLIVSCHIGERKPIGYQAKISLPDNCTSRMRNFSHATALHLVNHNCIETDKNTKSTPAVAAGILTCPMSIEQLVKLAI